MSFKLDLVALVALAVCCAIQVEAAGGRPEVALEPPFLSSVLIRARRAGNHGAMMHNHLSRKVFDRACAASKDTIDEVIACFQGNHALHNAISEGTAKGCYRDSFGLEFDAKDVTKHKELICNNREKFEAMTACVYKKTAETVDTKEMEKLAEAMVDVGLCIINALDG